MKIPLILGDINLHDIRIQMSGIRWLCSDGQYCKSGIPIAYCNVLLVKGDGSLLYNSGEIHDFQAVFITPFDGFIHIQKGNSHGGLIDQLPYYFFWDSKITICEIECEAQNFVLEAQQVQVIFAAGKRYFDAAENRTGILSGWFQRTRAWTGDRGQIKNTILTLGICDILNGLRGSEIVSLEFMELMPLSTQVILFQDGVLVPTVSMLLEQIKRTPENLSDLIVNFSVMIKSSTYIFESEDYLFLGAILNSLANSNFLDTTLTLTRSGVNENTPSNIVLISLAAQPTKLFRHKSLGYSIAFHGFRLQKMGAATRMWLKENFYLINRSVDEIASELRELCNLLGPNVRILVCNIAANPMSAFISHYDLFDKATFKEIGDINQRERNVMLDELASEGILEVVDLNLLSAKLGTSRNIPDGMHMTGVLEQEFLKELARIIIKK